MTFPTLPSVSHVSGDSGHPADHDLLVGAAQVAVYRAGGSTTTAALASYFNVMDYGATGNGTTHDDTAIQAAITAAGTGTVYFPPGTYILGASLTMTTNLTLRGAGRDATILKLANSVNDYAIKFTQASSAFITGAKFTDLQINGNASNQTAGGGISAVGSVESYYEDCHFTACYDWGLYLQGNGSGTFGHNNRINGCLFDNAANAGAGGGICTTSCDENMITACDFQFLGGATYGTGGGPNPACILDICGLNMITACTFVSSRGSATNVVGIQIQSATKTRVVGCTFDGVGGDGVFIAGTDCCIVGNHFSDIGSGGTAIGSGVQLQYGAVRNTVTANNMISSGTNGQTRSLVRENQMGSMGSNIIASNTFQVSGTTSNGVIEPNGIASQYRGNIGYNPVGHVTSPSVPTTTTALVNPFNVDCSVFITGGTVTVIAIGGTATGLTSGQVFVPAGQSITLTYSAAPSWTWFGN